MYETLILITEGLIVGAVCYYIERHNKGTTITAFLKEAFTGMF